MDDTGAMGGRNGVRNLNSDLQRLIERQRALLQPLLQRLAFQALHHQEVDLVLTPNIEYGTDVRMAESR